MVKSFINNNTNINKMENSNFIDSGAKEKVIIKQNSLKGVAVGGVLGFGISMLLDKPIYKTIAVVSGLIFGYGLSYTKHIDDNTFYE